jgi:hypothetical protein
MGVILLGEAKREVQAQPELRPTAPGGTNLGFCAFIAPGPQKTTIRHFLFHLAHFSHLHFSESQWMNGNAFF